MKSPLLLLHGALASAAQLKPLAREMSAFYDVHTMEFSGHGGRPLVASEFTMAGFVRELLAFLHDKKLPAVHVFGYSMGGYAALAAAVKAPEQFRSITTLGTKFDWSPATAALETRFLDAKKMREKVPQFVEQLELLHAPTPLSELLAATAVLMRGLGDVPLLTPEKLSTLEVPVQVLVGELDKTAGVDASRHFVDYMPRALFEIIMNTPHPLEKVNPDLLAARIIRFITSAEEGMV